MDFRWEDGFQISVRLEGGAAVISANRAGLLSLVNHLTALAQEAPGSHLHLDEFNSLEEGSLELVLERLGEDGQGGPRPKS